MPGAPPQPHIEHGHAARQDFPRPALVLTQKIVRWARVDVMTLARISRHKDLKILLAAYYRESPEQIAARL